MAGFALGVLGIGRLGYAVAQSLLQNPDLGTLYISKRSAARAAELARQDARVVVADTEQIVAASQCLIVALRPEAARQALAHSSFSATQHVISLVAEIKYPELRALCASAASVCRLLALPSIVNGGQVLPLYPENQYAMRIFGAQNQILVAKSEPDLLALWATTGMLSAVMMLGEVTTRWLERAGISAEHAASYSRTMFSEAWQASAAGFAQGIEHVSTPGGLNAMVYEKLQQAGFGAQFEQALEEVAQRLTKQ